MFKLADLFTPEELEALRANAKEYTGAIQEPGSAQEVSSISEGRQDVPGNSRQMGKGNREQCEFTKEGR